VASELLPLPEFVKNLPGRDSQATHDLVLFASQLPPLGSKSFYVGPPENETKRISLEINESYINSAVMKDKTINNEVTYYFKIHHRNNDRIYDLFHIKCY